MDSRQWVNQSRDELKGLAILWVVFFHALLSCGGILADIQKIGYGGVDIFFFLMGCGFFYSLRKSDELSGYWQRRLWRVLPAYLPLVILRLLVMLPSYGLSATQTAQSILGNLFTVGFWLDTPKLLYWYVSTVLLFVVLAPYLYALLTKSPRPGRTIAVMLAVSFAIGLCCIDDDRYMGLSRLPIFILGMAFPLDWRPKLPIWWKRVLLLFSFVAGVALLLYTFAYHPHTLYTYAMYWHPFILITPPLCIFLGFLLYKAPQAKPFLAPFRALGRASLEIYLVNMWAVELGKKYSAAGDAAWLLISVGSIALGLGYHWLVTLLAAKWHPRQA